MSVEEFELIENDEAAMLWSNGWAFLKSDEKPLNLLPKPDNCLEWMKGFLAALADYDLEPYREYHSVQEALHGQGISGDLLETCLVVAENVFNSDEWCRLPNVPIRLL